MTCIEQGFGDASESESCNCPIDGGYTEWGDWDSCGPCNDADTQGTQERTRTCTNPTPQYDGALNCTEQGLGDATESTTCECPRTTEADTLTTASETTESSTASSSTSSSSSALPMIAGAAGAVVAITTIIIIIIIIVIYKKKKSSNNFTVLVEEKKEHPEVSSIVVTPSIIEKGSVAPPKFTLLKGKKNLNQTQENISSDDKNMAKNMFETTNEKKDKTKGDDDNKSNKDQMVGSHDKIVTTDGAEVSTFRNVKSEHEARNVPLYETNRPNNVGAKVSTFRDDVSKDESKKLPSYERNVPTNVGSKISTFRDKRTEVPNQEKKLPSHNTTVPINASSKISTFRDNHTGAKNRTEGDKKSKTPNDDKTNMLKTDNEEEAGPPNQKTETETKGKKTKKKVMFNANEETADDNAEPSLPVKKETLPAKETESEFPEPQAEAKKLPKFKPKPFTPDDTEELILSVNPVNYNNAFYDGDQGDNPFNNPWNFKNPPIAMPRQNLGPKENFPRFVQKGMAKSDVLSQPQGSLSQPITAGLKPKGKATLPKPETVQLGQATIQKHGSQTDKEKQNNSGESDDSKGVGRYTPAPKVKINTTKNAEPSLGQRYFTFHLNDDDDKNDITVVS